MRYDFTAGEWAAIKPLATCGCIWGTIVNAVQMIDTSIVRVHSHGACIARE